MDLSLLFDNAVRSTAVPGQPTLTDSGLHLLG
jgi:hypothetical protein